MRFAPASLVGFDIAKAEVIYLSCGNDIGVTYTIDTDTEALSNEPTRTAV